MIWSLSSDDHQGQSCASGKFPLHKTISECLLGQRTITLSLTTSSHIDLTSGDNDRNGRNDISPRLLLSQIQNTSHLNARTNSLMKLTEESDQSFWQAKTDHRDMEKQEWNLLIFLALLATYVIYSLICISRAGLQLRGWCYRQHRC